MSRADRANGGKGRKNSKNSPSPSATRPAPKPPATQPPIQPAVAAPATESVTDPMGLALIAFLNAPTVDQKYAVLQRDQQYLLTEAAIDVIRMAIQAQEQVGDPNLVQHYRREGALLLMARDKGIPAAMEAYVDALRQERLQANLLSNTVEAWLNTPTYRDERRYLEEHLEVLEPGSDEVLALLSDRYTRNAQRLNDLRGHMLFLRDIRARGGTIASVRDSYVNAMGGFRLDLPEWLEAVETQDIALRQQGAAGVAERVAMLRDALTRARDDASLVPEIVSELAMRLYTALSESATSDDVDTQEEAIAALELTVQGYPQARFPRQWGLAAHTLGANYRARKRGDHAANVEQAIATYEAVLRVRTKENEPQDWALTQYNLGNAYLDRRQNDLLVNTDLAIVAYHAALEVFTEQESTHEWAAATANLALAENRREELLKMGTTPLLSIAELTASLKQITAEEAPAQWAKLQAALGDRYMASTEGDHERNLDRALAAYRAALHIWNADNEPILYALAQYNLGNAYGERLEGRRVENQTAAVAAYTAALTIFTPDEYPVQYAAAQHNLGMAYLMPGTGTMRQNIDKAIAAFDAALTVYTLEQFPPDHAMSQANRDRAITIRDEMAQ